MSKYTKRVSPQHTSKQKGTRKRAKEQYLGCSADYKITAEDKPRVEELEKRTNQELRDQISEMVGDATGKQTIYAATTKDALIRLLICMEHKQEITASGLIDKLTEFKPVQLDESVLHSSIIPNLLPVAVPCGEGQKCPTGFRCDKTKETCYELTQLTVHGNNQKVELTVDGHRGKPVDLSFLGSKIDRILAWKGSRDGKKITGKMLAEEIQRLKTLLGGKSKEVDGTYYGTLNDEMIIQIVYLEQLLQKAEPEPVREPTAVEPAQTTVITEPTAVEPTPTTVITEPTAVEPIPTALEPEPVHTAEPEPEIPPIEAVQEPLPDLKVNMSTTEQQLQEQIGVMPDDIDSAEYNKYLFKREKLEHANQTDDFLYPTLDDPQFNAKIATRKEFNDTKYDGKIYNIEKHADKMCSVDFELMPHQLFVKNFLSFHTPYNAMLLYHGLGTGKTCSAIGIAEEMRTYMKQIGHKHRIIVVASPNVQNNFKLQLFDERKLKKDGDVWNLNTCIGNTLLAEVIPTQTHSIPKEKLVSMITSLINQYYVFMGYGEFANFIKRKTQVDDVELGITQQEQKEMEIGKIRKIFNNRLVIIDEVHNIRLMQENKQSKKTANLLMHVCKYANDMRLLLLSATPMFNSYKEIIWLCNLLNMVDKRSTIKEEDVFDTDGAFLPPRTSKDGTPLEGGRELLQRKLTGYVSYVRGENPYSFPYRIYPELFAPEKVITSDTYPTLQMNKKPVDAPLKHVPVYMNENGSYQSQLYNYIITNMMTKPFATANLNSPEREMPSFENMESFGYTQLKEPLEALNIVFPYSNFGKPTDNMEEPEDAASIIRNMIGKQGLSNVMTYKTMRNPYELRYDFEYKPDILSQYGRIFHSENLPKYSGKIANICNIIRKSKGIIMIYSQYIDGGVVPIALALEEMGITRFGSASYTKSLFKTPPTEPVDALTLKPLSELENKSAFRPAKYVMITGDKAFSPNNLADLKYTTNMNNLYGESVRVILITKAAAEGLDFKNIRQLHVLEPWYNMNRTEQIIGRTVRNLSHCALPFAERNVEIYLHATSPVNNEETADLYVYRFAEKKAVQIGQVSRLLKETAVDCILNIEQTNFTVDKLMELAANQKVVLQLSSDLAINYQIGDRPGTDICDYMDNCNFVCSPSIDTTEEVKLTENTFSEEYAKMNFTSIVKHIRALFKEQVFYPRDILIRSIQINREYPIEHIDYALSYFIDNKNEHLVDKYGRMGYLINTDDIYAFQPIEITDENVSIWDRTVPVDYKPNSISLELPVEKGEPGTAAVKSVVSKKSDSVSDKYTTDYALNDIRSKYTTLQDSIFSKLADIKLYRNNATAIDHGETDWYRHLGKVYQRLNITHGIPDKFIERFAIFHYIDGLPIEDRLHLVYYLYHRTIVAEQATMDDTDSEPVSNAETEDQANRRRQKDIKQYFDGKIIRAEDQMGVVLASNNKIDLYIQNVETQQWQQAEATEIRSFHSDLQKRFSVPDQLILSTPTPPRVIGFMHIFKQNEMVFKIKEITNHRNNKGSKCSSMGKIDIIKRINRILEENPYSTTSTAIRYKPTDAETILRPGLCVIVEIITRYYNEHEGSSKKRVWFFDVEKTLANKIIDIKSA